MTEQMQPPVGSNDTLATPTPPSPLPSAGAVAGSASIGAARAPRRPFRPDRTDSSFALVACLLGFGFIRWVFDSWQGFGVAIFTLGYVLTVSYYLRRKGIASTGTARFWQVILLLTGLSYAVWQNNGLRGWCDLFLFGTAVYWVVAATGRQLLGRTSDWLPLDGLNGLLITPFTNFGAQWQSLAALRRHRPSVGKQQLLPIALGLLIALFVCSLVVPLLLSADSGGFAALADDIWQYFRWIRIDTELLLQLVLAVPTAAYLFGLVVGSAHGRGISVTPEQADANLRSARVLPATTVQLVLGSVSALYLVFIGSQLPYFFSAFVGTRPEGWLVYSEYARNGFFELCRIAVINLSLLAAANLAGQADYRQSKSLRLLNSLLAGLTLLLIATALSKMALYIGAYGLSMRRLLPCVLMVLLAVICIGVIVRQHRQFSLLRLTAVLGAVLLCTLSLINVDGLVVRYNTDRYLAGTLADYDQDILFRAGPAGVTGAQRVLAQTSDPELREQLRGYLDFIQEHTRYIAGQSRDTVQSWLVRQRLSSDQASR